MRSLMATIYENERAAAREQGRAPDYQRALREAQEASTPRPWEPIPRRDATRDAPPLANGPHPHGDPLAVAIDRMERTIDVPGIVPGMMLPPLPPARVDTQSRAAHADRPCRWCGLVRSRLASPASDDDCPSRPLWHRALHSRALGYTVAGLLLLGAALLFLLAFLAVVLPVQPR